jgi:hypothetical protein
MIETAKSRVGNAVSGQLIVVVHKTVAIQNIGARASYRFTQRSPSQ